jgi:medium-chain acyl-[acyl-carrier-protein] hydrolase
MKSSWLAPTPPNPYARVRLFCFHHAGGGPASYLPWSEQLPPEITVCPLILPGREARLKERPYRRMAPLVQAIAVALQPYMDKPFAFFGHSMGALVSFEVARQLRRQFGQSPVRLFISAHRSPQLPHSQPTIHTLPDEALLQRLTNLGGSPREMLNHQELMQLMLPTIRADFAVCETYVWQPEPPFACPITVFAGAQDTVMPVSEMDGWCQETDGSCRLCVLPGNHFFLHTAQTLLLAQIMHDLQKSCEELVTDEA